MPVFYKYLFLIFIVFSSLYLFGLIKEEKIKHNYIGIAGVFLLQLCLILLYVVNTVKF